MRYAGQAFELPVPGATRPDPADLAARRAHRQVHLEQSVPLGTLGGVLGRGQRAHERQFLVDDCDPGALGGAYYMPPLYPMILAAAFLALSYENIWIELSGLPPRRLPEYYSRHNFARLTRRALGHYGDLSKLVASPLKLSATPVTLRHAPPLLGQHTDEVLTELGLDARELAQLREQHVIGP